MKKGGTMRDKGVAGQGTSFRGVLSGIYEISVKYKRGVELVRMIDLRGGFIIELFIN